MNQYNWDNLEVGRYDLNHSENFFEFKHSKHEKFCLESGNEAMIDEEDIKGNYNEVLSEKQDPLNCEKDSRLKPGEKLGSSTQRLKETAHSEIMNIVIEKCNHYCKESSIHISTKPNDLRIEIDPGTTSSDDNKENCNGNNAKSIDSYQYNKVSVETQHISEKLSYREALKPLEVDVRSVETRNDKIISNSSSTKENVLSNLLKHPLESGSNLPNQKKEKVPSVIKYVEIYEKKRQNIIKKQIENDQKNRIFHSKPAPKFSVTQANSFKKIRNKKITEPITPRVVKNSIKAAEKMKKIENINEKSKKYHAVEAKVLYESPFIPKKETHFVETQPFNLHVEKRLCERKCFDQKIQKQMEERKKKEEEERIKREEELSKEFRKMTTFKARPNPFK